ncbi:EscU/YscU/HrcU family type III secretion system export apparatus switch protein [Serratia quinivorans]|uniref:EscU/YscU/HrcU family type III secretion system export apparatus switch protein n=1 Tax=Serratia quinivorans TaxID=137545 RepID=UPI0021774DD5|nr:EscU/YscU/HrcU family type III secretion system export apparatus switch protein [Serratia quinivorans]CAI1008167.1 Yop proteins translocation protein U [Serratia quinivorans]CAI1808645.1 Yop proteins translocation protein U [Serratia quinivorans]
MSEKTERPTDKRLREARKKGQVVKSDEITSAVQIALIGVLFLFCGWQWYQQVMQLLVETLRRVTTPELVDVHQVMLLWGLLVAKIVGTLTLGLIVVTLAVQLAQVGVLFSSQVFADAADRLNPVKNLQQLISLKKLFDLAKSLVKVILIGAIFYIILRRNLISLQYLPLCGVDCAIPLFSSLIFQLIIGLLVGYLIFSLADYAFQRHSVMKQLRMSKEEIKQEFKDAEGNPEMKQRRREIQREIQHEGWQRKVKNSSLVIKNPTHIAICLQFDLHSMPLPRVIEKAQGERARQISALAESAGIPVVENIPLARGLMREVAVGGFISPEFFEPVAEIIRMVMKLQYDVSNPG